MKLTVFFATVLILSSMSFAGRRGKPMSGTFENDVFTDSVGGYSLHIDKNWKTKTRPIEDEIRLEMIHQDPPVETKGFYKNVGPKKNATAYSKVRVILTGVTNAKEALDSMITMESSWSVRKDIWAEMKPMISGFSGDWFPDRVTTVSNRSITVESRKAFQWRGNISFKAGGTDSEVSMGLFVTSIERKGNVILLVASCNASIMDWLASETTKLIESMKLME